tara:strand:- start:99 stop:389 length:291 start_codon:yes stop_codon:yes gene_type:complete
MTYTIEKITQCKLTHTATNCENVWVVEDPVFYNGHQMPAFEIIEDPDFESEYLYRINIRKPFHTDDGSLMYLYFKLDGANTVTECLYKIENKKLME